MNVKTDGRGRVQISAFSSVTTMSLRQARQVFNDLDKAIHQASIEDTERIAAVLEAQQRMAEALS